MDSFGLRQEQSELLKSVAELNHKLEIGEARIKELHSEEMRYLEEIPVYKNQAEDIRIRSKELMNKYEILNKNLIIEEQKLCNIQTSVAKEEQALIELKETEQKIINENKDINETIKNRHIDLNIRETEIDKRESDLIIKEDSCKRIELDLVKRESDVVNKEKNISSGHDNLNSALEIHTNNLSIYSQNVRSLAEQRGFLEEDKIILKDKLAKADKVIKDQIELKAALLLQAEKLSKEISLTQAKQSSLDKNIADLINQENSLKIKELKISKMARDAGLIKELAELSK